MITIYCPNCGRPTGEVVIDTKFQKMSYQDKLCAGCAPYAEAESPQQYVCENCGYDTFSISQSGWRPYECVIERSNDGGLFASVSNNPTDEFSGNDIYSEEAMCIDCGRTVAVST